MKLPVVFLSTAFALSACATATPVYDRYGEPAMLISCDGAAVPISACYDKANDVCPDGYFMLGAEDRNDGWISGAYGGGTINKKSVMVRCKS